MSSLQDAEIVSLVIANAEKKDLIRMLKALLENGVVFTEADCKQICNRNLPILYDFAQRYVNINSILQHGNFLSISYSMLQYFVTCGAELDLLDQIMPYDILSDRDCIHFFNERGYKLNEHFIWAINNYHEDSPGYNEEIQQLLDFGLVIPESFLETHYSVFLMTKFPPHNNPLIQLQTIFNDCVEVMQLLDLRHTIYTVELINETVLWDDCPQQLRDRSTFTALDFALALKSWKVTKLLIEQNADVSPDLDLEYPDDIRELLFYNYPSLSIELTFDINRAKELWNPVKRKMITVLANLRDTEGNVWETLPNELLFLIISNL